MKKQTNQTVSGGILMDYVAEAIEQGFDELTVEYKDGQEMVFVQNKGVGIGIASLKSDGEEAAALRHELFRLAKSSKKIRLWDNEYILKARIFDSFGENAFRVLIKPTATD